ncbi:MAG: ABC transporter permease subunit [Eubacteriales bacterium]
MLVYIRELQQNKKGLIAWTIIIGLMLILMISLYPEISKNKEAFENMLESMGTILKVMGMSELNMDNILNYYSLEGYIMISLFGSIYAVMLSASILSKEQSEKTVEFLLSKPISRISIVFQKFLAMLSLIIVFNIALSIIVLIMFNIFADTAISISLFLWICFAPFMLHITLASLGFVTSIFIKKSRTSIYYALGIVFVFYAISIVAGLTDVFSFLKSISPFDYANASTIISNNGMKGHHIFIMIFVMVASFVTSVYLFERKNITV